MHVESSSEPGKAPKHAGQKKTYRAIAETYAFLPREAVTRFLMSCTECQKRMHFNSNGLEPKESEPPSSLVSGIIDYNMPLTSTYLKQMKLRVMNSQEQDETSVSSEDFDMNDSTWISADQHLNSSLSPSQDESMRSPQNLHGQEDGVPPGGWISDRHRLRSLPVHLQLAVSRGPPQLPAPAPGAGVLQAWRGDPLSPLPATGRRPALCGAGCSFPCLGSCPVGSVCGPQARNVSSAGAGRDEAAGWPRDVSSLWAGAWKGLEVLHVGWVGGSLWHEVVLCFFCEASWFKEMLE
uniref:Nucleolar protein 4 like n=1 Tax=Anas platyrhynchos platyrhynchos TaxID=8840 RepID=A0A493TRT6_ANAPP